MWIGKIKALYLYQKFAIAYKKWIVERDPVKEINRCYKKVFDGKLPDLKNPKNLIEKIYWMELYADTALWSKCTDKYLMREYVKDCGLADYLPKLLAHWDKAEEMDFTGLPKEFILKTNNGCGTCYIVKDKGKEDIAKIKRRFKRWLSLKTQGYSNAQLHYLNIQPCIIAEELLHPSEIEQQISPSSLIDYKVWCFSGKPVCILVVYDRNEHSYYLDLYDTKWNRIDKWLRKDSIMFKDVTIPKPDVLDKMLEMASVLSKPFVEVRVDFYIINNIPVIGELTFSTGYGYYTEEFYDYLGSMIDLNKVKKVR